jgi:hypothetical protein
MKREKRIVLNIENIFLKPFRNPNDHGQDVNKSLNVYTRFTAYNVVMLQAVVSIGGPTGSD